MDIDWLIKLIPAGGVGDSLLSAGNLISEPEAAQRKNALLPY
jgi:hypothetical protein